MQIIAIVVSLAITAVAVPLFARTIMRQVSVIRLGQPAHRTDSLGQRIGTALKETLLHTRMLQWTKVGIAHWIIMVGFGLLFFTLVNAYGQLFDAHFILPVIGHFFLFEWITEAFAVTMIWAILALMVYRATRPKERVRGEPGRLWGSTMWQGYFVEWVILLVGLCILVLRFAEYALAEEKYQSALHFPFTFFVGEQLTGWSEGSLANLIWFTAMLKIVVSMVWMLVLSQNATMGVAWHRFLAPFNILFKREPDGRTALGAMKPLTSAGKPVTLDDIEDLDEDATLGVGQVEDFSWKGILDFTTCTECGRCQSQCPAWNTEKPLSPKLLITAMRDHAYAKAPYLQAGGSAEGGSEAATALLERDPDLAREVERPLVGDTGDDWFYMPDDGSAVIDPDVLWSCTSCGACVQQCPVDIEHVDHIMDMRRYQVLVEANFPAELNQLFKGLENKGNPWNMSPNARMDWAKGLDFDVKVVGEDIESLESVDWLFWVGCAGAYEDRAKKTTRAVAELLDMAGVSFGVLGNGETCNGDPARRAGNEFVFQGLAQQNVETFKQYQVKKVVSTCAHCFNTLKNEYKDFGIELEVVHHTQLLNRLVREGRLTPIKEGAGAAKRSITYHDPCYLGRHNQVYSPPRELLQVLPGAEYVEMERNSERSFCCGAGGARMWMEENIGERINVNRTKEAVGTGADQIAVGCPFCRVMLSDGLTAEQASGGAREEVEVLDVAQMLLASVKGEQATKAAPGSAAKKAAAAPAGAGAAVGAGTATGTTTAPGDADVATKDEPEPGDVTVTDDTVTDTADAGPAAKASGGSSLFDTPADSGGSSLFDTPADSGGSSLFDTPADSATASEEKSVPAEAAAAEPESSGGSLFDLDAPEPATAKAADEPAEAARKTEPTADLGSGGSLFDLGSPEPAEATASPSSGGPATEPAPEKVAEAPPTQEDSAPPAAAPSAGIPEGGSLFDLAAPEPTTSGGPATEPAPEKVAEAPPTQEDSVPPAAAPSAEIPQGGSLFDLPAPEAAPISTRGGSAPEPTTEVVADAPAPEAPAGGAALSQAATEAASDGVGAESPGDSAPSAPDTPAEQDPSEEGTADEENPEQAAHQPRTDAEINESGSLFDL